jgi:hypothetical protein
MKENIGSICFLLVIVYVLVLAIAMPLGELGVIDITRETAGKYMSLFPLVAILFIVAKLCFDEEDDKN